MLKIDPILKDLIPPLQPDEYKVLEESIKAEGCRDKIVTWQGYIVDGHNRYDICTRYGIEYETDERFFEDIEAVKVWMIDNQKGRRNLTDGWKWELAQTRKAILAEKGRENLRTNVGGDHMGLSIIDKGTKHNTQAAIAQDLGWSTGKVAMADKVWKEADPEVKEKVKAGEVSINQAYQEVKKANKIMDREAKRQQAVEHLTKASMRYNEDDIKIHFEDFRKGCESIPDNSIDAIITDPPYPIEYIDLWGDMFEIADRVLKPSAFLVTYANHQNLDRIFQLPNKLKYYWTFKLDFTVKPIAMGRNLIATWKPVIVYQKYPFKKIEETIEDQVHETKEFNYEERDLHDLNWGQSLGKFEYLIQKFSKPGDTILEPFAGTGTTLVACKNTSRKCIGYEIEREKYESIIKGRIVEGI